MCALRRVLGALERHYLGNRPKVQMLSFSSLEADSKPQSKVRTMVLQLGLGLAIEQF